MIEGTWYEKDFFPNWCLSFVEEYESHETINEIKIEETIGEEESKIGEKNVEMSKKTKPNRY